MAAGKTRSAAPAAEAGEDKKSPLYLLFGADEYLVSGYSRKLVEKLCPPADQAFGLETIEARVDNAAEAVAAIRRCIEGVQTVGFLGGGKVVWLRDANFFGTGQPSEAQDTKAAVEQLVELIRGGIPPGQVLVVSASKVDKRSAFYKACQAAGKLMEYDLPEKGYQVEQHAREMATAAFRRAELRCGEDVMEEFIGRTGADTRQIVQEANKLAVYLGDRKDVRVEDVRDIVSPAREAVVWDLAEAVGNRDLPGALEKLKQLSFQGENAVGLIIGLEGLFRELVVFRECMDRKWLRVRHEGNRVFTDWSKSPEAEELLSAMPKDPRAMHWFRASKIAAQAGKFTLREAARCQQLVLETHEKMFSSSLPAAMLMEFLVLKLLGEDDGKRRTSNVEH